MTEADRLALIPIANRKLLEFYQPALIPAKTYAWQPGDVGTIAVKAVLVSYDFRNLDCDQVGRFAQILYENIGWLRENGHPKWKSVDLDVALKGCGAVRLRAPVSGEEGRTRRSGRPGRPARSTPSWKP